MPLDFPANPTNGQAYGAYIYNATVGAWQAKEDPATVAVTSDVAPASANNGDIWYNTTTGVSYVYYNDGNSGQWVEIVSSAVPSLNTKANLDGGNSFTGTQTFGTPIGLSSGGTNASLTGVNGGVVWSSATALGIIAAGTSGQVLKSNGAAAPSWQTLDLSYLPDAAFKKSVKAATTANITLSGTQTIDGIALVAGDRVLVKNQSTASQNGIYDVASGSWTRPADANLASEMGGAVVNVDSGTQGGQLWTTSFKTTDTLGTTTMNWYRVVDTSYTIPVSQGGTGTNSGTISDIAINRITNPAGAALSTTTVSQTGAIRITLPVGWTSHMHKFTVSVYEYVSNKSFTVEIAGYNFSGTGWFNPSAYITGQRNANVNYTVRFGYTAGGRACIYIGETSSTWVYPQVSVNNVLVGFSASSTSWLSGWGIDFVTSFENVSQTVTNTQIVAGLVPMLPTSVSLGSGSSSVSALGEVTFSGATSVQLNGVFTDAYTNYRVVVRGSSEDNRGYAWRFTANGTQNTNSTYHYTMLWTAGSVGTASTNSISYMGYSLGHRYFSAEGSVFAPRISGHVKQLYVSYSGLNSAMNGNENHSIAGTLRETAYIADGIIFFPSAGTISGTMQVLGVAK